MMRTISVSLVAASLSCAVHSEYNLRDSEIRKLQDETVTVQLSDGEQREIDVSKVETRHDTWPYTRSLSLEEAMKTPPTEPTRLLAVDRAVVSCGIRTPLLGAGIGGLIGAVIPHLGRQKKSELSLHPAWGVMVTAVIGLGLATLISYRVCPQSFDDVVVTPAPSQP